MTMPNERAQALRFAGEILREMLARDDVPADLRYQARVALCHYPDPYKLEQMVSDIDRMPREILDQRWLAPDDADQSHATGTVLGNDAKGQSTTNWNESNALQSAPDQSEWGSVLPVGREFASPDYDRLEELDSLACQVLGVKRFREWLSTPIPALDGKTPEEISASHSGAEQIRQLLSDLNEELNRPGY